MNVTHVEKEPSTNSLSRPARLLEPRGSTVESRLSRNLRAEKESHLLVTLFQASMRAPTERKILLETEEFPSGWTAAFLERYSPITRFIVRVLLRRMKKK